jgi:shikimate dehydrogenase
VSHVLDLGAVRIAYEAPSPRTLVYLLLGSPVQHSLSPRMQNAGLQAEGIDGVYLACEVPIESAMEVVTALRQHAATGLVGGMNVTAPLKQVAAAAMDALAAPTRLAGAVNTVVIERASASQPVRLVGHNTDVQGLVAALAEHGVALRGAHVFVAGTGGMARAAVTAALQAGARDVSVGGRDAQSASQLLDACTGAWEGTLPHLRACALAEARACLADADVVVHATRLGMQQEDPLALDIGDAPPGLFVLDAVYGDGPTALVRAARRHGLRACDGRALLLHQGAAAFTLWTGRPAPLAAMRQALGL